MDQNRQRPRRSSDVDGRISGKNVSNQKGNNWEDQNLSGVGERVPLDDEPDYEALLLRQAGIEEEPSYHQNNQTTNRYELNGNRGQKQAKTTGNNRKAKSGRTSHGTMSGPSVTVPRMGNGIQSNSGHGRKEKRKRKKSRHIVKTIILILLLLVLAIAAFAASKFSKINRTNIGDVHTNDISEDSKKIMSGYTTIALFGLDNRSNGNFDAGNSDCIILASINNKTKEIRMASVYRDTYLDIGDGKYNKANAAYQKGGPKQAIEMLNKNLDLAVQDYVAVDWNALVETIDLLGGVDIELTDREAELTRGYIDEIAEQTGNAVEYPGAGLQTLSGVQATAYARIRYTEGWDYKRTERQRLVIDKIFEKAKKADVMTLNKIVDKVFPDISTSLSNTEILSLASGVASYSMGENTGFPFEKAASQQGAAALGGPKDIVVPVNLDNNVLELHKFLYAEENYTVSSQVQEISQSIIDQLGQFTAQ